MKVSFFGILMIVLYLAGAAVAVYVAWTGWEYYSLTVLDRPHAELHTLLKPGGLWGHGLGVIGSAMIILLFLYSLRKRGRLGLRFGRMNRWLDIHIFFGIMGPILITLHTAGKLHGIVAISYYSMMAVMVSGFLGRYLYMHIPRDETGHVLSMTEINNSIEGIAEMLMRDYAMDADSVRSVNRFAGGSAVEPSALAGFLSMIGSDLVRPINRWRLRRYIRRLHPEVPSRVVTVIAQLAGRRATLMRRRALLRMVNSVFHYWHVAHKPFAIIMVIIMLVHVTVVTLMGYKWIF